MNPPHTADERVLVLAPTGLDGALACNFLSEHGLPALECRSIHELLTRIGEGAGAAVIAEEALEPRNLEQLLDTLQRQPEWSDLPLIVLTRPGDAVEVILGVIGTRANVSVLERPLRVRTFTSAVKAALRARSRQYRMRALLAQLADADKRKDEFLAVLGHELRSPLSAIRAASLNLRSSAVSGERAERQLGIIDRQSENLRRLVEDLLDISRISAGKLTLQKSVVDLNEIAERVEQIAEPLARSRGHALSLRRADGPVRVEGDRVRLEQIVQNLVTNAIKYTPDGGRIEVWVGTEFGRACLRVVDNGLGIAPEMLPCIFEAFVQVPSAQQYAAGGLGLGLPLVDKLVRLHGGEIRASSQGPGRGSVFTVTLPLAASASQTLPISPQPPRTAVRRLRILLVEDNADLREAMKELIADWGHEVVEAADGLEAVQMARQAQPDLALVDLGLPGLDGLEVARRVRAMEDTAHRLRLVALTGYSGEATTRALEAGFDQHLVKPVDETALQRLLDAQPSLH